MPMNTLKATRGPLKEKGEERRRYLRNDLMLRVEGKAMSNGIGSSSLKFQGVTSDVSLRGLSLAVDRNLGIYLNQEVKLQIKLFQNESPIEAVGRLCWVREKDYSRRELSTQVVGIELLVIANSIRCYDRWIERITWN